MEVDDTVEKASSQKAAFVLRACAPALIDYEKYVPAQPDPIIFFSSDSTALYKGDVFRCLALPEGHTIQFRYRKQWMHSELVDAPQKTKDRFGLIVFVGGNDERVPKQQRTLTYHSVRFCTVRDAVFDDDTEQLLVILELNQFVKCEFKVPQTPPDIFVTPGKITECEPSTWLQCVRRLESYYPDTLFFRLNRVFAKTEMVSPTYLNDFRLSRFDLLEETDYSLECIYYDPSGQGNLPLSIKCDSDQIEISNTFASGAGADLDKRLIHLKTGLLTSRSARAFIIFSSCGTDRSVDPNHVQTLWAIQRKGSKPWKFAGCVLVGALGLALMQIGTKASASWAVVLLLIGSACVAGSAGLLYLYFNKT